MVKPKQTQPLITDDVLLITIDELQRTMDWLDASYRNTKTKTLTFMGGGFALMTFLYASGDLFFPPELYGRIIYVVGLALIIAALVILFLSMLPRRWEFTTDYKDLCEMNFEDKNHYLQYVKDNYMAAYKNNMYTYDRNNKLLTSSFYPLVIGAILLVVLKIFGT